MKIDIKPPQIKTSFKTEKIYPQLEELTVIPSVEKQNYKGTYGEITIQGVTADIDEDIKPENIRKNINILGVDGGYEGIDTSDATATVENVLQDKTFYANNQKHVGTMQEYDGSYSGNTSSGSDIEITDASYLFYEGARTEHINEILKLCENLTNIEYMFYHCENLTSLNLKGITTLNSKTMDNVFTNCEELLELDVSDFDTSNATSFQNMFNYCEKIETLDLNSFDLGKANRINYFLGNCYNLTNLKSFKNLGKAYTQKSHNYSSYKLDVSKSTLLTRESLIDIITNGLYDLNLTYDVTNGGTLYRQSLVLGATNLAKLTEEEIAIATNKGWNVS